jgi:hypothetical protein
MPLRHLRLPVLALLLAGCTGTGAPPGDRRCPGGVHDLLLAEIRVAGKDFDE